MSLSPDDDLLAEIISRRENECNPPWPCSEWDYTEWEEAIDEYRRRKNERFNMGLF